MMSMTTCSLACSALHLVVLAGLAVSRTSTETFFNAGAGLFLLLGLYFGYLVFRAEDYWPVLTAASLTYALSIAVNGPAGVWFAERFAATGSKEGAMVWLVNVILIPGAWLIASVLRLLRSGA